MFEVEKKCLAKLKTPIFNIFPTSEHDENQNLEVFLLYLSKIIFMLREIALIVAYNKNKGIGINGDLLYHIPADLKHFKTITTNYPVIMGRKTFESLPKGPLPNRTNIVISKKMKPYENVLVFDNLGLAIDYAEKSNFDKLFFIGGGKIYQEVLNLNWINTMYITYIDDNKKADTFFPDFNINEWDLVENIENIDDKTNLKFYFQKYVKKV